jgi:hypothetical protein
MRLMLFLVVLSLGCAGTTANKCKGYVKLSTMIALQLAEDIDPASPESKELRARWAKVGEEAVQAGCEEWAE